MDEILCIFLWYYFICQFFVSLSAWLFVTLQNWFSARKMRKTFVKKNPISFHRFYGSKSIYHRIIRFEFSWIFVLKSTRKTNSVLFEAVGLSCLQCMRYGHMRSFFYSKCRKCAFQPFLIHSILQSHDSHQGINQFFFPFVCMHLHSTLKVHHWLHTIYVKLVFSLRLMFRIFPNPIE